MVAGSLTLPGAAFGSVDRVLYLIRFSCYRSVFVNPLSPRRGSLSPRCLQSLASIDDHYSIREVDLGGLAVCLCCVILDVRRVLWHSNCCVADWVYGVASLGTLRLRRMSSARKPGAWLDRLASFLSLCTQMKPNHCIMELRDGQCSANNVICSPLLAARGGDDASY